MEKDMPAKFNKESDAYYLKDTNGNISDFPESKKQLTKLFPDKKTAIENFVKENKIDFDADADRVKIVDFLAQ
jgi:cephalosporin hydroxylase